MNVCCNFTIVSFCEFCLFEVGREALTPPVKIKHNLEHDRILCEVEGGGGGVGTY